MFSHFDLLEIIDFLAVGSYFLKLEYFDKHYHFLLMYPPSVGYFDDESPLLLQLPVLADL